MATQDLETLLTRLTPETRLLTDRLRALIHAAAPGLEEGVLWNAPSFRAAGADRITLNYPARGGVRVILHRGARAGDGSDFAFDWSDAPGCQPSPERGLVPIRDMTDLEAKAERIADLIARWVAANR